MLTSTKQLICALAALVATASASRAQEARAGAPSESTKATVATPAIGSSAVARSAELAPTKLAQASPVPARPTASVVPVQPAATAVETPAVSQTTAASPDSVTESGGVGVREFQGDDVGQVLRLLARQAKINMVVSEAVTGTVTMRLEDVTALQAIAIIVKSKGLSMDQIDNVYYIKTPAERTAEPTESDTYQFSYARAKTVQSLRLTRSLSTPAKIRPKSTSVPIAFFSARRAATSITSASCWCRSTSQPNRS